jgi:SAM-dependent methyltransferase
MHRFFCLVDFLEWTKKYGLFNVPSLSVFVTDSNDYELSTLDQFLTIDNRNRRSSSPAATMTVFSYDETWGLGDLHGLLELKGRLPGEPFDFMLVSQTLEHLFDPLKALKGLISRLKEGGCLFTSLPTVSIPHMMPFHFQGLTPIGLITLLTRAGFEVKEIGQWGNVDYVTKMMQSQKWPSFSTLKQPVLNDRNVPVQVWALACRPLANHSSSSEGRH